MSRKRFACAAALAQLAGVTAWLFGPLRSTSRLAAESGLRILSPTLLELTRVNTKQPDPSRVESWDFIAVSGAATLPSPAQFSVLADGRSVAVEAVGFKRRPLYAPLAKRDLRIDNRFTSGSPARSKTARRCAWKIPTARFGPRG